MAPGMAPGMGGIPGAPGGAGGGRGKGNQLFPGITMLGEFKQQAKLIERAREQGIDVLFIFDIEVSAQGETVLNKTKIEVFNMHAGERGESAYSGRTLTNNGVAKAREERKGDDPVETEMNRLFTVIDETFQPKPFPATATAEKVEKHVSSFVGKKYADPLPILAELRFYFEKKLITTEKFAEVAKSVAGDEAGAAVASGNGELILASLAKWLPEKRPKKIVVDGGGAGVAAGAEGGGFFGKLFGGGKK